MLEVIIQTMPFLFEGFINTIVISLTAIAFGSGLGVILGLLRTLGRPYIKNIIGFYIHMIRATPFLVQIYLVYFILPGVGWEIFDLSEFAAAVVALSIYTSSYTAEIVRSALEAVPKGQWEAATAVGMNTFRKIYYVIAPQAWKMTLPPLAGVYVLVIKGTSILSVIGVIELMRTGEDSIYRYPSHIMLILCMVGTMYFIYCYPILKLIKRLETKLGRIEGIAKEGRDM